MYIKSNIIAGWSKQTREELYKETLERYNSLTSSDQNLTISVGEILADIATFKKSMFLIDDNQLRVEDFVSAEDSSTITVDGIPYRFAKSDSFKDIGLWDLLYKLGEEGEASRVLIDLSTTVSASKDVLFSKQE